MATLRHVMPQVARVWDALFSEGSKILFRTALAVLKAQEDSLLAIDNAGEAAVQGVVMPQVAHSLTDALAGVNAIRCDSSSLCTSHTNSITSGKPTVLHDQS
jgi:hypothetical protein